MATSAIARTCVVKFAAKEVDVAREVLPCAGGARHVRLAAKTPFHPDLAGHGGDLIGENRKRGRHVVDGFGESSDLAFGLHCEILLEVAVRDSSHDLHDAAHLLGEVGRHDVYRVGEVLPGTRNAWHLRLAAELAFGTHLARHACHL